MPSQVCIEIAPGILARPLTLVAGVSTEQRCEPGRNVTTVGVLLSASMDPQATIQCPHALQETSGMERMYKLDCKTARAMAGERAQYYTKTPEVVRHAMSNDSG